MGGASHWTSKWDRPFVFFLVGGPTHVGRTLALGAWLATSPRQPIVS